MYHPAGSSMQYSRRVCGVGSWVVALALASCDGAATDARADEHLRQALGASPPPGAPSAGRPSTEAETTDALRRAMSSPPDALVLPDSDRDSLQQQAPPTVDRALLDAPWLAYFPTGSSRSRARDAGRLAAAARAIRLLGGAPEVEVHGYADATGTEPRNVTLSRARAEAVITALQALGVGHARLRAVAHGSSEPQVPDTPRDRWQNRRVRLVVGG